MRVIVVGAGLGGLTLALGLGRAGIDTVVVEQAQAFGEAGAGVQLSPNATRALSSLGLDMQAIGFAPEAAEVRDHKTQRLLLRNPLGAAAQSRWRAPYLQVHRADLHALLLQAVRDVGRSTFRLGAKVAGAAGGAASLDSGETLEGDAVIGCDGVRSAVRAALLGDDAPRFARQVAWRGTVPANGLPSGLIEPIAQVWTGPRSHFVHYPVRGGALINFVAVTEEDRWRIESWSERGDKAVLSQTFQAWPEPARALIAAADEVWRWALFDRPLMARWSKDEASLLGDAAHPMTPFLAQGAAMAIEDAVVLARCLSSGDPVAGALLRYERARRARTAKVQAWSRRNAVLFHLPGPAAAGAFAAAAALDAITPGGASARFDWLYGYDAATAPI